MQAVYLTKQANAHDSFEIREAERPVPGINEAMIQVEAFGLNFADVLARQGMYKDAPPIPAILGYEVVGTIALMGANVEGFQIGQRVVAFTRFGGYAQYAVSDQRAMEAIPDHWEQGKALALATQYCTAYYAAYESLNLHEEDKVLIHSAAGGVGIALSQLVRLKGCTIFGTASRDEKMEVMKSNGVHHPINYREKDFRTAIQKALGEDRLDVIFESLGGRYFKQSMQLLGAGGRIVGFGASSRSGGAKNIFNTLKLVAGFGFFSPVQILMKSQAIIGVYMLAVADYQPKKLQRCLQDVVALAKEDKLHPYVGATYPADQIGEAHAHLQSGRSIGKIAVKW